MSLKTDALKKFVEVNKVFSNETKQPYYNQIMSTVKSVYKEYLKGYTDVINHLIDNSEDYGGNLTEEDVIQAFYDNPGPVKAFHETLTTVECIPDLISFTDREFVDIDFNSETEHFIVTVYDPSWNGNFSYHFSLEEIQKASETGYIKKQMENYKKEVILDMTYEDTRQQYSKGKSDEELERRRIERLRQMYETENIER